MSTAELSDTGSLTPPLNDIEKQWQEFGFDDDIVNIETELSPKRQKTGEFNEESKTNFQRESIRPNVNTVKGNWAYTLGGICVAV